MTLVSRLSAAFLGAVGLILVGFSTALYLLASVQLHRSVDNQLEATLATITTLVEVEPGGLEWESHDRRVIHGQDSGSDQVRWAAFDHRGRFLDRSPNLRESDPLDRPGSRRIDARGRPWRVVSRRLESSKPPASNEDPGHLPAIVLVAGLRLDPVESTLRNLALTLLGLSAGVWACTALVGRRLCRRALAPLTRMAGASRELGADDPSIRLPVSPTGDELEDLAHAFNGLLDRRHEALERQRRFTGDASHQLRTPLTAVIGQLDVALRRERSVDEYRRVLTLVRDQSDHLRRIVEALLFLSRADAEAGSPALDRFDLAPWVAEQLDRRCAMGCPDRPDFEQPTDGPYPIRAHPELLAQVLDNLLDNAREHGRSHSPAQVRIWRDSGFIALSVEDRGPGIAPEDLPRIFEHFYRATSPKRNGTAGFGLGLSVAQRIARASGGTLVAESPAGLGSRFILRIPEARCPDPDPWEFAHKPHDACKQESQ
ncbi:ATP-binding protein [Tundrisphaera lichenicola]|uniref:ATP-binding protein n=1 Tax=Tundrisphaera lichenicola TaxID=2029860 RepID=UPI003EB7638F